MKVDSFEYPILCLTKNGGVFFQYSKAETFRSTQRAVNGRLFDGMVVVDPKQNAWEVHRAEIVAFRPPLWGWRLPFFTRSVDIVLESVSRGQLRLDEIKNLVLQTIDTDLEFWGEVEDVSSLRERIARCGGFLELEEIFGNNRQRGDTK
jgi:hypothetical protein